MMSIMQLDTLLPLIVLSLVAVVCISIVVANMGVRLRQAKDSEAELRRNFDLTLHAWARVLEYREKESKGHSHRVVELSTQLAQALGFSPAEIGHLRRGALLHDIGKLAVPDEILLKPGELNDAERKLLERHPEYAKQMLSGISFLQPAVEVAYSHHERWDGLGYPEGLKGEGIPLFARVFAVVEQWDALTSDRPHRKAWSKEAGIHYFRENAGKIYDPQIVGVFLTLIRSDET
jgi:putative nucleotidyltransferase with HDIG domain